MLDSNSSTPITFPKKWMSSREIGAVMKLSKIAVVRIMKEIGAEKRWDTKSMHDRWVFNTDDYARYIKQLNLGK